jgi:sugar phosphate isomerase/epimerase
MLDTKSAALSERRPVVEVAREALAANAIAHVQLNDRNRRGPGQGEDRFAPVLAALLEAGYDRDVAIEPFDYVPDGPACAAHAIGYVRGMLEALRGS